ncbi:MAG: hypothetical protein IJT77_15285, partial [Clostridia bacterium]|nr:hypothetical protein [Clostridia bacterium]
KPLRDLKKEIRRHRRQAAVLAALIVFVAVYTYFYHVNSMQILPWKEGLIQVKVVESVDAQEYSSGADSETGQVQALIIRMDSRMNAISDSVIEDDEGTTVLLQGYSLKSGSESRIRDYNEKVYYPVPDRLVYNWGDQSELIWGKAMSGGAMVLPRLALAYYVLVAIALEVLLGVIWFVVRHRRYAGLIRQMFFVPVSYIGAHLLLKGFTITSFLMERDFIGILVLSTALYALISEAWQAFIRGRRFT